LVVPPNEGFDVLVITDAYLKHQQNLATPRRPAALTRRPLGAFSFVR
jgi:hypothetical protein